jgi:hypothetical protein
MVGGVSALLSLLLLFILTDILKFHYLVSFILGFFIVNSISYMASRHFSADHDDAGDSDNWAAQDLLLGRARSAHIGVPGLQATRKGKMAGTDGSISSRPAGGISLRPFRSGKWLGIPVFSRSMVCIASHVCHRAAEIRQ